MAGGGATRATAALVTMCTALGCARAAFVRPRGVPKLACPEGTKPVELRDERGRWVETCERMTWVETCDRVKGLVVVRRAERHGPVRAWLGTAKVAEGGFEHDRLHGPWTERYPGGQKRAQGTFRHGERSGRWTTWFENGAKHSEGEYAADALFGRGKRTGWWTWWNPSGDIVKQTLLRGGEGFAPP